MTQTVRTDDGIAIEYKTYGSGPLTALFLHGWGNAASFWDDLFTQGNVYFNTVGSSPNRQFVVEWFDKDPFDSPGITPGYTFELVLNEADSTIDFNYSNVVTGSAVHDNGATKHQRSCTEGPVFAGASVAWA